jgi:SAM-dependent methyltransferase
MSKGRQEGAIATRLMRVALGALLWGAVIGAPAFAPADEVPYIQTPSNVVDAMLAIAEVGPKDYVVDLGSGDGRIVIAAAKRYGARGLGIDYDQSLIAESRLNAARAGVSDRVRFLQQDIFLADFHDATVVTMYLLPEVNLEIRPQILFGLRPGTRVVSHDWDMGDWESDRRMVVPAPEKIVGLRKESTIHLWVVPARVAGYWQGTLTGPGGVESVVVEFSQRFQNASATVWLRRWNLTGIARLQGDRLSLSLDRASWMPDSAPLRFTLQVADGRLEGEALDGDTRYTLRATRLSD